MTSASREMPSASVTAKTACISVRVTRSSTWVGPSGQRRRRAAVSPPGIACCIAVNQMLAMTR